MKTKILVILVTIILHGFKSQAASNSMSDAIEKILGLAPPSPSEVRNSETSLKTFELTALEGVNLAQGVTFNIISNFAKETFGKFFPYVSFVSNIIDFFKSGFWTNGSPSVWEQVKSKVRRELQVMIRLG
jgi:hypothetical protein